LGVCVCGEGVFLWGVCLCVWCGVVCVLGECVCVE
jgi:hypothetical protein